MGKLIECPGDSRPCPHSQDDCLCYQRSLRRDYEAKVSLIVFGAAVITALLIWFMLWR